MHKPNIGLKNTKKYELLTFFILLNCTIFYDLSTYINWKLGNFLVACAIAPWCFKNSSFAFKYKVPIFLIVYPFFQWICNPYDFYLFSIEYVRVLFGYVYFLYFQIILEHNKNLLTGIFFSTFALLGILVFVESELVSFNISVYLIVLFFKINRSNYKKNFIYLMIVITCMSNTHWRAVALAGTIQLVFYVCYHISNRKFKQAALLALSFSLIVYVCFNHQINNYLFTDVFTNNSQIDSGRFRLWDNYIVKWQNNTISEKCFGVGLGNSAKILWNEYFGSNLFDFKFARDIDGLKSTMHPHNMILWLLCELGIFGSVIYCTTIYLNLRKNIEAKLLYLFIFTLGAFSGGGYPVALCHFIYFSMIVKNKENYCSK
jgi:hypothetical protein